MKRLLISATVLVTLTACSSMGKVDYDCPLDGSATSAHCASMEDAYKLSRNSSNEGISVFGNKHASPEAQAAQAQPYFNGQSNYPATQTGMPVFQQPKVMRVWLAPYVDADGNLRSGEYTYFATPGAWNYGSLQSPGEASGAFQPSNPDSLGFNPVPQASTSKNSNDNRAGSSARPSVPGQTSNTLTPSNSQGITQPYQRISQ